MRQAKLQWKLLQETTKISIKYYNMSKTALLTVTGAVSADIVTKSLKRMGFRLVGCDCHPKEWIIGSNEVDVFYQAPLISDSKAYLSFIKEICIKENVSFVLPFIDLEVDLFSENRDWFDEHNIKLCISGKDTINTLRNKKKLSDFIEKECPETNSIPTLFLRDIEELPWQFPVVCKPYNGRSSQGLNYIHNKEEWENFCKEADKDLFIVEPFIEGPIVMVEIVRQPDTHKTVAMTRRELASTPHGLSTTVYIYQDELLERNSIILAEKLGISGNVNFEYLLDPAGQYHFVECNPRFSAGCEFSCIGGYDIIENHMKCFMGEDIEDYHFKHTMVIARRYEEVLTCVGKEMPYCNTAK